MEKASKTPKATPTEAVAVPTAEPRNFLAAFLLVLSFGQMGLNRIYTGDSTVGWTRFALYGAGMLLTPVIIGVPLLVAAHIWGWIDIFLVYKGDRTDAQGVAMTQTTRDARVAHIFFVLFIISVVLMIVFFTFLLAFGMSGFFSHSDRWYDARELQSF